MSRALDKARAAVTAAEAEHDRWAAALHDAEAAAAAADQAEATTPGDLDRIGQEAARTAARVSAAQRALATAATRLDTARRAALHAEANAEADAARAARKEYESHAAKVRSLLDQLEKLDGTRYGNPPDFSGPGWAKHPAQSVSLALFNRAGLHEARAAVLRYTAANGHAPTWVHELVPRPESLLVSDQLVGEHIPASVRAYVAATNPPAPEPEPDEPTERDFYPRWSDKDDDDEQADQDFRVLQAD